MKNKNIFKVIFSVGALALAACGSTSGALTSSTPPPLNEPEVKPALQNPRAEIWRAGYWLPSGDGGFEWIPGKLIPRPSPSAVWAPAYWAHHAYGWTFVAGHWQ